MIDAIQRFIDWVIQLFTDILEFFTDLPIQVYKAFLDGIVNIFSSIPAPSFINGGMQSYLSSIDPSVLYFLSQSGLSAGFAILGAAFAFRMTRKLFTLGQW